MANAQFVIVSSFGSPGAVAMGDGSVRIGGANNLDQMISAVVAAASPGGLRLLQISSPGIIAVLIGLLLPAGQRSPFAAGMPSGGQADLSQLSRLRPLFAPGGRLELRGLDLTKVGVGTTSLGTALSALARALNVEVAAGPASAVTDKWTGPITTASPLGGVSFGLLLPAV